MSRKVSPYELYVSTEKKDEKQYIIGPKQAGYVLLSEYSFVAQKQQSDVDKYDLIPDSALRAEKSPDLGKSSNGGVVALGKPSITFTDDLNQLITSPDRSTVFVLGDLVTLPEPVGVPGLVSPTIAHDINMKLVELCKTVEGTDSLTTLQGFLTTVLQAALQFSTSNAKEYKDTDVIKTPTGKFLSWLEVSKACNEGAASGGYENPTRQYLRYYSSTVTNAILNNKLRPNSKVMAQHGVPPKFYAYCFDFAWPDPKTYNNSAMLAWNLARERAFKSKQQANDTTLHNVYQLMKQ